MIKKSLRNRLHAEIVPNVGIFQKKTVLSQACFQIRATIQHYHGVIFIRKRF